MNFTNALGASFAGRPGPVHLTIPSDVFSAQMPDSAVAHLQGAPSTITYVNPQSPGDPDLIRDAVKQLCDAERPCHYWSATERSYANAGPALAQFSGLTHIPIFSNMWSRGCIETQLDAYVGTTFGGETNGAFGCLAEVDLALVLGAGNRLSGRIWSSSCLL